MADKAMAVPGISSIWKNFARGRRKAHGHTAPHTHAMAPVAHGDGGNLRHLSACGLGDLSDHIGRRSTMLLGLAASLTGAPARLLRLRVSLAGFLTCVVLAYAGHLFALPGRDIQAGFRFTVLGFPGVVKAPST
jgi:hypothetical protein